MSQAQRRFAGILRAQARIADARSAELSSPAEAAWRNTLAADLLRDTAERFTATMSHDELAALEAMTEQEMRALAVGIRLTTARETGEAGEAAPRE